MQKTCHTKGKMSAAHTYRALSLHSHRITEDVPTSHCDKKFSPECSCSKCLKGTNQKSILLPTSQGGRQKPLEGQNALPALIYFIPFSFCSVKVNLHLICLLTGEAACWRNKSRQQNNRWWPCQVKDKLNATFSSSSSVPWQVELNSLPHNCPTETSKKEKLSALKPRCLSVIL